MPRAKKKGDGRGLIFVIFIAFAVVSFWRGVWRLMDQYLFPNDPLLSTWSSVFIGLAILVLTKYARKELI